MAWTTPGTAVAGAVLTSSFWNEQVRDQFTELAPFFTTWTTWTTTVTQSVNVTHTRDYARYLKIGRMVIAMCHLSMTGSGTTNNAINVTLPVLPSSSITNGATIGVGRVIDQNIADYSVVVVKVLNDVQFKITGTTSSAGSSVGQNPNFGLVNTDVINMIVVYESAS